jgi:hypothetical protein
MKKIGVTVIAVLIVCAGFGQTSNNHQSTLDSVSTIVIHYLQAKQSDSIYALAGEMFKSKISAADFKSISENQVFPLNDFKNVTYVSTMNGINKYKVAGTPDLQLFISLDKDNKLETFLLQPFSDN